MRERITISPRPLNVVARIWDSTIFRILLAAATLGLALWVLWGPHLRHAHFYPQFGDMGGWLAGIGSLAAVVVALFQTHQLHLERLDDLRRQDEHQRTQVFSWIAYRDDAGASGGWWIYFNNMTPAPIGIWVMHIADAATGCQLTLDVTQLLPILPGFTQRPAEVSPGDLLRPTSQFEFCDAAGVCWQRDTSSSIHQIPEIRLGDQVLAVSTATEGGQRGR